MTKKKGELPPEAEPKKEEEPGKVSPPPNPPASTSNMSTPRQTPDQGFGAESMPKP